MTPKPANCAVSPGFMVLISSTFHGAVATAPSTTTPSAAWLIVMPIAARGMVRRRPRAQRADHELGEAAHDQPDAEAEGDRRQRRAAVDRDGGDDRGDHATRRRRRAGGPARAAISARFQARNGPTQSAANSGAQIGTKVALKNGGPTETLLPVSRSRNSG